MSAVSHQPVASKKADDMAAAILLREVEGLLAEGQPRQAIAHIVEMTGVERPLAEQFVSELQQKVFTQD